MIATEEKNSNKKESFWDKKIDIPFLNKKLEDSNTSTEDTTSPEKTKISKEFNSLKDGFKTEK